jgi:RNA polymerase subunit RPABC4/transcription elongation factor Spt4
VARGDRRRSRQWRFSDSPRRFGAQRNYRSITDHQPISDTFTRKILYCRRCGNRVVSNVSHCPFCGKSLLPFFKRLWFWLLVVVLSAAATVALIVLAPETGDVAPPQETPLPVVIGAPPTMAAKDLAVGTTVDCSNLLVTVTGVAHDLVASDGSPITTVEIQFLNKGAEAVALYSTQWQLETTDGERHDRYIGKTSEGVNVGGSLDSQDLGKDGTLAVSLSFAVEGAIRVVYAPDALSYSEAGLVTWSVASSASQGGVE